MNGKNQVDARQQNAINEAILLQTGLRMEKKLQPKTGVLGDQLRINLERAGITTGVWLEFEIPVDITVGVATRSVFGPHSIVNGIQYTDYSGLQRVNTNGPLLHILNCLRGGRMLGNSAVNMGYVIPETGLDTNILKHPTAVAADSIYFSLYVPMAYDPSNDLRGSILSQTIWGDHYITIDLASALVGTDQLTHPYSAGTVALQAGQEITVRAFQQYIMPQAGVENLPMLTLSQIYAVEGNYNDSSNIVAGQPKYINWPNNRNIHSAVHIYNNGGAGVLNGTDVSAITLLGNSNTHIREHTPRRLREMQRNLLGSDLANGVYVISSRAQPITTQLYGNVQSVFDIVTANAGAYFLNQYESIYLSGTPLPGVIQ